VSGPWLGLLLPAVCATPGGGGAEGAPVLEPGTLLELPAPPDRVLAGDLDGDGAPDLLTGDGQQLWILLGRGDGSFDPSADLGPAASDPALRLVADLDGDGDLDLLLGRSRPEPVLTPWLRTATGEWLPAEPLALPGDARPQRLEALDLDGDGLRDLLVLDARGRLLLFQGAGAAAFRPLRPRETAEGLRSLLVEDLDGDGFQDLVLGTGDGVEILLSAGSPEPSAAGRLDLPVAADRLALLDGTGDGVEDLLVLTASPPALFLAEGLGAGAFATARPAAEIPPWHEARFADLDRDGQMDLLLGRAGADSLMILRGRRGRFVQEEPVALGFEPAGLALADVDRDRRPEILAWGGEAGAGRIAVLRLPGEAREPTLLPATLRAGGTAELLVDGIRSHAEVFLLYSPSGPGRSRVVGLELDLAAPVFLLAEVAAGALGEARFVVQIPADAAGRMAWLQAVEYAEGSKRATNAVALRIRD